MKREDEIIAEFLDAHPDEPTVLGTGSLATFEGQLVFVLQRTEYWERCEGSTSAGYQAIGGEREGDETMVECLERECREEVDVTGDIHNAERTYIERGGELQETAWDGELSPLLVYERSYRADTGYWHLLNFTYLLELSGEPRPKTEVPAVVSVDADRFASTAGRIYHEDSQDVSIVSKDALPQNICLYPVFTAKVLHEYANTLINVHDVT